MRVLYDFQAFNQRIGGVSRYAISLIRNLPKDIEPLLPNILSDNVYIKKYGVKHRSFAESNKSPLKGKVYITLNIMQSLWELKTTNFDIFHPLFCNPYYVGHTGNHKIVTTVHDLNFYTYPEMLPNAEGVQHKMEVTCKDADAIICVSEETKQNLLKYIDIPEERCHVILEGCEQTLIHSNGARLHKEPYILYIGGRNGYKNFPRFLQAYSKMETKVDLVCTGSSWKPSEIELINRLGIKNRIFQKFVTDDELGNLLCNAEFFVYPSLAEGFGLPILEAARCHCPCVVSDLMCFHEVAGDTALYFNPKSVDDITKTLEKAISDAARLKHLADLGQENLKNFTWKKTAEETAEVYRSLV